MYPCGDARIIQRARGFFNMGRPFPARFFRKRRPNAGGGWGAIPTASLSNEFPVADGQTVRDIYMIPGRTVEDALAKADVILGHTEGTIPVMPRRGFFR